MGKPSYDARYMKHYREKNPGKQEEWRISSEIRHLQSLGYEIKRKTPEEMTVAQLGNVIDQAKQRNRECQRRWKQKNREHLREYQRKYRQEHPEINKKPSPEKAREYRARWREKHREQIREYAREYYREHTEQARESRQKWRAKNPHYEALRWQRYKEALKARQEERDRIRRNVETNKKGVSEND